VIDKNWMDVNIRLQGRKVSIKELLNIDLTDLSSEFAAQAAMYAYIGVLTAEAEKIWNLATRHRKRVEAEAFKYYKDDEHSIPMGSRSVSDSLATHLIAMDEEVIDARTKEIETQFRFNVLRSVTIAFYTRSSMLQSTGATLRHEEDVTGLATSERDEVDSELREHIRRRADGVKYYEKDPEIPF